MYVNYCWTSYNTQARYSKTKGQRESDGMGEFSTLSQCRQLAVITHCPPYAPHALLTGTEILIVGFVHNRLHLMAVLIGVCWPSVGHKMAVLSASSEFRWENPPFKMKCTSACQSGVGWKQFWILTFTELHALFLLWLMQPCSGLFSY